MTGVGVLIVPAMLLSWTGAGILLPRTFSTEGRYLLGLAFLAGVASLLGLTDDLLGDSGDRGFAGHFRALARGRITTGLIKAVGGVAASAVVAGLFAPGPLGVVIGSLTMASCMNLGNLLDVRPGRALKAWFLVLGLLFAFSRGGVMWAVWGSFLGVGAVLLAADLREYSMLGDAGSNALGAVIGFLFVVNFDLKVWLVLLPVLLLLQLASERWSFTRVIEGIAPLKWVDELGRPTGPQMDT